MMRLAAYARAILFATGLGAVALGLVFNPNYATDSSNPPPTIPEPATTTLVALGGIAAITASLVRRRKK